MKTAIISGANGFIGTKLAEYLLKKDTEVYCLIQKGSKMHPCVSIDNKYIIEMELDDLLDLKDSLPKGADVFYHLAWSGVSTTKKNEYQTQMENIGYTLKGLEFAKDIQCRKVICPGSVSEYAYVDGPVTGLQMPAPADAYSASKIAAHFLGNIFAKQNDIDFNWVLIPSIYGPGREDNNLITYAIKSLLNGERPAFTKLEQMWDYLYVDDLIKSLYLIGGQGVRGKIYVTGSGDPRKMADFVQVIHNAIDPSLPVGIGDLPYKSKQIDNAVVDITELQKDTGYQPQYTFEEGIRKTIDYFMQKNN
jgi:nucleoside-diphosphate-sugar epimerase